MSTYGIHILRIITFLLQFIACTTSLAKCSHSNQTACTISSNASMTWTEARKFCADHSAQLPFMAPTPDPWVANTKSIWLSLASQPDNDWRWIGSGIILENQGCYFESPSDPVLHEDSFTVTEASDCLHACMHYTYYTVTKARRGVFCRCGNSYTKYMASEGCDDRNACRAQEFDGFTPLVDDDDNADLSGSGIDPQVDGAHPGHFDPSHPENGGIGDTNMTDGTGYGPTQYPRDASGTGDNDGNSPTDGDQSEWSTTPPASGSDGGGNWRSGWPGSGPIPEPDGTGTNRRNPPRGNPPKRKRRPGQDDGKRKQPPGGRPRLRRGLQEGRHVSPPDDYCTMMVYRTNAEGNYSNWTFSENALISHEVEECAVLHRNTFQWTPCACRKKQYYICHLQYKHEGLCNQTNYNYDQALKSCLFVSSNKKSFLEAMYDCRVKGGELVELTNETWQHSVREALGSSRRRDRYWIGLSRWKPVSQEPIYPDDDVEEICLVSEQGGQGRRRTMADCFEKHSVLCIKTAKEPGASTSSSDFPIKEVIIGVVAAIVGSILILIVICVCVMCRNKKALAPKNPDEDEVKVKTGNVYETTNRDSGIYDSINEDDITQETYEGLQQKTEINPYLNSVRYQHIMSNEEMQAVIAQSNNSAKKSAVYDNPPTPVGGRSAGNGSVVSSAVKNSPVLPPGINHDYLTPNADGATSLPLKRPPLLPPSSRPETPNGAMHQNQNQADNTPKTADESGNDYLQIIA